MSIQKKLQCDESLGKGRALCVLVDMEYLDSSVITEEKVRRLCALLGENNKVYKISCSGIDYRKVAELRDEFLELCKREKIRQAGFLSFGACSALLWQLAISDQKRIRYALVVDGEARPKSSLKERVSQWLEAHLPLGLPFRVSEGVFYALPFLQRFRFPVVIFATSEAAFEEQNLLEHELPVAWAVRYVKDAPLARTFHQKSATSFNSTDFMGVSAPIQPRCVSTHRRPAQTVNPHEICTLKPLATKSGEISGLEDQIQEHILRLASVPAKCPQKNRTEKQQEATRC